MNKDSVDKGYTGWNLHYKLKAKRSSLSNVNKQNTQKYSEAYSLNIGVLKTQTGVKMTQYEQKIRTAVSLGSQNPS
jgi:3,4-dihydroxy-2-butanone 4-phosphate synthase